VQDEDFGPNGDRRKEEADIYAYCGSNPIPLTCTVRWLDVQWGCYINNIPIGCTPEVKVKDSCGLETTFTGTITSSI